MSEEEIAHRRLTKALLVSVALGVLPLATVGCVQPPEEAVLTASERQQYFEAARSASPQMVDAFLAAFPDSRYAPALLNALPPRTIARLSPNIVANLSAQTIAHLSPRVRAQLRLIAANADVAPAEAAPPPDAPVSGEPLSQQGSRNSQRGY